MSITPYLDGLEVDPETKRVLGAALEMTRVSLGIADDFANGIIAKQIIELAKAGERNPDLLCEAQSRNCAGICTATNTEIIRVAPTRRYSRWDGTCHEARVNARHDQLTNGAACAWFGLRNQAVFLGVHPVCRCVRICTDRERPRPNKARREQRIPG